MNYFYSVLKEAIREYLNRFTMTETEAKELLKKIQQRLNIMRKKGTEDECGTNKARKGKG